MTRYERTRKFEFDRCLLSITTEVNCMVLYPEMEPVRIFDDRYRSKPFRPDRSTGIPAGLKSRRVPDRTGR